MNLTCLHRDERVCVSLCLYVCLFVRSHNVKLTRPNFTKFFVRTVRVTCGRISVLFYNDSAIRYVLPVLWMTSCLPVWRVANRTYIESDSPGGSTGAKFDVYTIALFTSAMKVKFSSMFVCLSVSNFAQKLPKHWDSAYLCQGTSYQCRDRDIGTGKTCLGRRYALSQWF